MPHAASCPDNQNRVSRLELTDVAQALQRRHGPLRHGRRLFKGETRWLFGQHGGRGTDPLGETAEPGVGDVAVSTSAVSRASGPP